MTFLPNFVKSNTFKHHFKSNIPYYIFIACLAIFSLSVMFFFQTGVFGDDIQYLLAAQSFDAGSYVKIFHPENPLNANYYAGYPSFLYFLSFIFGWNITFFKIVNVLLFWAAIIMFAAILKVSREKPRIIMMTAPLCLFNPTLVMYAGSIMADVLFMLLSYVVILCLIVEGNAPDKKRNKIMFYAACTGAICSFYVRPTGAVNILCIVLYFIGRKDMKAVVYALLLIVLGILPLLLFNVIGQGHPVHYLGEALSVHTLGAYGSLLESLSVNLLENLKVYAHYFSSEAILWMPKVIVEHKLILTIIILVHGLILFAGILSRQDSRGLKVLFVWSYIYGAVHLFWVNSADRYMLPLIPVVMYAFLLGILSLVDRFNIKRTRYLPVILISSIMISYLKPNMHASAVSRDNFKNNAMTQENLYLWIKNNIPHSAIFLCLFPANLYYFTHNKAYRFPYETDPDRFYYYCNTKNIDYIYFKKHILIKKSIQTGKSFLTVLHYSNNYVVNNNHYEHRRYELLYSDQEHQEQGVRIFKVIHNREFTRNYAIFDQCHALYLEQRYQQALDLVPLMLHRSPGLVSVHCLAGFVYLSHSLYDRAVQEFNKAIQIDPSYFNNYIGLALAYLSIDRDVSYDMFAKAEEVCSENKDHNLLGKISELKKKSFVNR